MPEPLVTRLEDLRSALTRSLQAVEERVGSELALADDYYWHLPIDAAFDLTAEPTSLTTGQLSDDLEHLLEGAEVKPATAWHDLAHLIGLLRG